MKKIDYYAVQNPWRMPKWVGIMLGGVFGVIAIGSMVTIVQLTRPPAAPAPVAAVAAAAVAAPTEAAPAAAVAPAVKESAPLAAADDDASVSKKHATKKHARASKKAMKLASAKHSPAPSNALDASKRQTILAKHDTKAKRSEKDALDKLLGL